ncbi:hypothetical protein BXY64_1968 [Marinifilum flexuosum]|uniref:Uncharacterized protein n=2 Tax=Marinifilum flexuosum TaxID=1117708 RepID=A0A419XB00_9BACT|nr:hypothetical protein BXY64_1968 [Marinifilum flexuosum]
MRTKYKNMKKLLHLTFALIAVFMLSTLPANAGNGDWDIVITKNNNWRVENIKISTNGDIEFNEDYTDVKAMSDDAYIKISMVSFGMKRKLYIRSDEGRINYRYYEGSREVDFEPKGRAWMKKMLPDIVRNSGLDLENRVNKIYKKSGVTGFLNELQETDSDYYRSRMVKYLLKNNKLDKSELQNLLREFPYRISSDYELSQIYKKYNPVFIQDPEISAEFFNSLDEISSNYELSQVLKSVYKLNELNEENFTHFIEAMGDISSSYEKSNLMKMALADDKLTEAQLNKVLSEVEELSSSYEKSQIIKSIIKDEGLSSGNVNKIIELTESVSSDYEMGQIINSMIREEMISNSNLNEFTELLGNISSDYTYKGILDQLIEYEQLGEDRFDFLLKASDDISSSYELSKFYKTLLVKGNLTKKQQLTLISKSENISSNYELASFLLTATHQMDLEDKEIKDALIKATQEISSEYEYGKVMKAIYSK